MTDANDLTCNGCGEYVGSELASHIEALEAENVLLKTAGIIEVAARNPSVMDYMKHWEGRAEAAEAKLAKAVEALEAFDTFDRLPLEMKRPDIFEIKVRRKLLAAYRELKGGDA